jgi:hypothetical protein
MATASTWGSLRSDETTFSPYRVADYSGAGTGFPPDGKCRHSVSEIETLTCICWQYRLGFPVL